MFRPADHHGELNPNSRKPSAGYELYWFALEAVDHERGFVSGYVTREQFDWLADKFGLPALPRASEAPSHNAHADERASAASPDDPTAQAENMQGASHVR